MSEEMLADSSALDQPESAAVDTIVASPEEASVEQKLFTQEELDAALGKRLAIERRKIEREIRNKPVPPVAPAAPVTPDQFSSDEAYVDALAEQKAARLFEQRDQQKKEFEVNESFHEKVESVRVKYDDFDVVAFNPDIPVSNAMAEIIRSSDVGPDLAYYLGKNREEAVRISEMTVAQQGAALARLEVKISNAPPVKKTSSAPAPISPVNPRGSASVEYDTTDPRSVGKMSASEWIERENKREMAALRAKYAN
jgi:hypothetical protein